MTKIAYVFWDCDNTLVHTAEHHWLKNLHVLKRHGVDLPEEHKHRVFLQGSPQNYEWFISELGLKCDRDTYLREVDAWFTENAGQIKITGKREFQKTYKHHTGYPGGLKEKSFEELLAKKPEFIIANAVRGMLPKTRLGNQLIKKLKVYAGSEHPHQAQKPEVISL